MDRAYDRAYDKKIKLAKATHKLGLDPAPQCPNPKAPYRSILSKAP